MNDYEKLSNLREKHRKEENELIYELTLKYLKPSDLEIQAARVKLFDEEMPKELGVRKYVKLIERLKHRFHQWERREIEK